MMCVTGTNWSTTVYSKVLQEANEELNEKVKDIQRDLEESTAEMNKMTDEYTKLKVCSGE